MQYFYDQLRSNTVKGEVSISTLSLGVLQHGSHGYNVENKRLL